MSSYTITPQSAPAAREKPRTLVGLALLVAVSALAAAGCEATFTPAQVSGQLDVATVFAPTVPYDIATYPHVWYEGTWLYLVDGVWYAPTPRGWVVLREEPRELGRYRSYYEPGSSRRYEPTLPEERGRYRRY